MRSRFSYDRTMNSVRISFISLLIFGAAAYHDALPISSIISLPNAPARVRDKPAAISASQKPPKNPSNDFLVNPKMLKGDDDAAFDRAPDCVTQRQRMVAADHGNESQLKGYVPACTGNDDKLYDAVQCHKQTGYCWCVNQLTNEPVPGSSRLHKKPNCTAVQTQPRVSTVIARKSIKGCKSRKQKQFFNRLFQSILTEMIAANGTRRKGRKGPSKNEIAKWKFNLMDVNHNKVLEKREWHSYRGELRRLHKLRKCGRNFIRFCDQDRNKKITQDEWKTCTVHASKVDRLSLGNSRAKNPFLYILKPEGAQSAETLPLHGD
ncbi:hypothetical protein L596_027507 [Steinernema carpocapsae]|uniref:Thyroglobulin type-1 domain-containing protein n=2 Tax=Steinernema carpocapsae TaxID=34508 RepID=A0A4V5ZXK7_STECR|nr:hypothetical protein L596_027507 [Steinernema carpocapsae]